MSKYPLASVPFSTPLMEKVWSPYVKSKLRKNSFASLCGVVCGTVTLNVMGSGKVVVKIVYDSLEPGEPYVNGTGPREPMRGRLGE